MNTVNRPFRKKDAMQLVTGQPVYMDDLVPADCLIVKLLRSPHANAIVKSIDTAVAKKVPGIEAIFTWEDVPQDARRYTQAGQTYPEASPYDRLLIDRHVRFVGDVVAIVAGKDGIHHTDCVKAPQVVDPTAAGDSFVAAFCTGLTAGLPVNLQGLVGANGKVFGLESFGFSAPYKVLDEKLGFTALNVYNQVKEML